MKPRPDLLDKNSPEGIEVFQLTENPDVPSCHIYMEAQIFTPDSKRFLLHTNATPHSGNSVYMAGQRSSGAHGQPPGHQYLLCDMEGEMIPVTDEESATAPSVSLDGKTFYYIVTEFSPKARIHLRRRNIDGTAPETLGTIEGAILGTSFVPSRIYPLSTLSPDGNRLAIAAFLGDGIHPGAPWGMLVFDLRDGKCHIPVQGPSWCNPHLQYTRSLDPARAHDLLVQENHGNRYNEAGDMEKLVCEAVGCDLHVIRDDGQHFRDLPLGRDTREFCMGHQCWRGRSDWIISTILVGDEVHLMEARAMPHDDHRGALIAGGERNRLCREFPDPQFSHFATDIRGERLITDYKGKDKDALYLMQLGEPGRDAFRSERFLLRPGSSWHKDAHVHPFLSPDGSAAFFNSDESGQLQAYMIRNLPET